MDPHFRVDNIGHVIGLCIACRRAPERGGVPQRRERRQRVGRRRVKRDGPTTRLARI